MLNLLQRIEIADKQIEYYRPPTQWSYCARNKCIEHSNIESSSLKIFVLLHYLSCATISAVENICEGFISVSRPAGATYHRLYMPYGYETYKRH